MHKFKFLATQCAIASSPTRSPTTSPVVHLRRRKTLRMLLGRGGSGGGGGGGCRRMMTPRHDDVSTDRKQEVASTERSVSNKLRDLFVSSPPAFGDRGNEREGLLMPVGSGGVGRRSGGGVGGRVVRPLSSTLRQRLLRRAWRPVLVAIPE